MLLSARKRWRARVAAIFVMVCAASAEPAIAQMAGWGLLEDSTRPPVVLPASPLVGVNISTNRSNLQRRGPLARLVRTPEPSAALPPFALADRGGVVQRYVEPVPGIDLEPYVNQVVIVRHDTGRTLLASQLELPPQPLVPLLGESSDVSQIDIRNPAQRASMSPIVQPAQFVDHDDATVQLLTEGGEASGATQQSPDVQDQSPEAAKTESPGEELPGMMGGGNATQSHRDLDVIGDSTVCDPGILEGYTAEWDGVGPCPECGGYHFSPECGPEFMGDFGHSMRSGRKRPARLFADVELNFLRTHINGAAVGKLSEKYEFSPRVIIGFRETGLLDGRARFWHYDQEIPVLNGGSSIRVQFDVLDLEATQLFTGRRSEILVAGGLRLASIDLTDDDGDRAGADLLGITFAAEGRTWLGSFEGGRFALVYGGRLAVLGGDWGAELGSDFLPGLTQDDNVVVHELIAGIDYTVCHHNVDLHARLGFEMQNWHSDALSPDSIGVIGPGVQFGAEF
jgi:hypothetical protein